MEFEDLIPGRVSYCESFLPKLYATRLIGQLKDGCAWSQERFTVRGPDNVTVPLPRLVAWHGDTGITYRYSGIDHPSNDWTPALLEVRQRLREAFPEMLINGCLLNWYRTGNDSIGRHGDREDDLVPDSPIMCVTLGTQRTLTFRQNKKSEIGGYNQRIQVTPEHGSLLIMYGDCQRTWTHEIRKEPSVVGERISMTFRSVRV